MTFADATCRHLRGSLIPLLSCTALVACGGAGNDVATTTPTGVTATAAPSTLDQQLRARIDALGLTGNPARNLSVPDIDSPQAQLGMRLFFSKSLGGDFDAACVSCHHPLLGGGDGLSLSVGTAAIDPELLGLGRGPADGRVRVARNAPTTFNVALQDRALFADGRVESLTPAAGANGAGGGIRTPDSAFGDADPDAGDTLPAAQSRFPIVTPEEMLGGLLPGASHATLRDRLAQRIGDYGAGAGELANNQWLPLFQAASGIADSAEHLITDTSIAAAIAAYERSQVFVDTAWSDYVGGDLAAISDQAKRGALLFLTPVAAGGAGCNGCHSGDRFTDDAFHTAAFPQFGPGKGDGPDGDDDYGRARETGNDAERYAFRTPSLLNVALSAPYGHAGAYTSLTQVLHHYNDPRGTVTAFFDDGGACLLPQFTDGTAGDCATLYSDARAHSMAALAKVQDDRAAGRRSLPNIRLNDVQIAELVAYLESLTDRCAADPACLARWIPDRDGGPDNRQLDAVDVHGDPL